MINYVITLLSLTLVITASPAATVEPAAVATVVVHGFALDGADSEDVFGIDEPPDDIAPIAALAGLPTGDVNPTAPNQVAYTTYYGNQYPPY